MTEDTVGPGSDEREDDVAGPGPDERDPIPVDPREGDDEEDGEADPYAPEPSSTPIDPETPSVESSVFVLLGMAVTVLVILRMGAILGI